MKSRESLEERIICTGIVSASNIYLYIALGKQSYVAEIGDKEHVQLKATSMGGNIWCYHQYEVCSQLVAVLG